MGKLTRRILAVLSGTIVNKVDGAGSISDILPGDKVGLYVVRGTDAPVLLTRKNGQTAEVTIPAALLSIHDALAIEMSLRLLFRTKDETTMTATERQGLLQREVQPGAVIAGSDENPWA